MSKETILVTDSHVEHPNKVTIRENVDIINLDTFHKALQTCGFELPRYTGGNGSQLIELRRTGDESPIYFDQCLIINPESEGFMAYFVTKIQGEPITTDRFPIDSLETGSVQIHNAFMVVVMELFNNVATEYNRTLKQI